MKCRTKRCRGRTTKSGHSPYCAKCRSRHWREHDPVKYKFDNLRNRARQRGKEFSLTIAQFREFCQREKLLDRRGRSSKSYSIDRIKSHLGYSISNIQVLEIGENVRRRYVRLPDYVKAEMEAAEKASKEPF